jgi:hypothetical protein
MLKEKGGAGAIARRALVEEMRHVRAWQDTRNKGEMAYENHPTPPKFFGRERTPPGLANSEIKSPKEVRFEAVRVIGEGWSSGSG